MANSFDKGKIGEDEASSLLELKKIN